jgi:hypothetical protein
MTTSCSVCRRHGALALLVGVSLVAGVASAQGELSYAQYRAIAETADRLQHVAMFEPLSGQPGMNVVIGDRFGKLDVYYLEPGNKSTLLWKSQQLAGNADEVLCADLSGDGLDDSILARTSSGRLYVWALDGFQLLFQSLPNDYQQIQAFTVANVDQDPQSEIILDADHKIYYVDGKSFTRDFTSLQDFEATRMCVGDVDGDGRPDLVLNTGQVIDTATGAVKWEEETFGTRVQLLDIDGDGILEVLTESDGLPLRVFDIDYKNEKRFQ